MVLHRHFQITLSIFLIIEPSTLRYLKLISNFEQGYFYYIKIIYHINCNIHTHTHTQNTHHSKDTHEDVADTLLPHRMWKTRSTLLHFPLRRRKKVNRGGERKGIGEKKGMGRGDGQRFFFKSRGRFE